MIETTSDFRAANYATTSSCRLAAQGTACRRRRRCPRQMRATSAVSAGGARGSYVQMRAREALWRALFRIRNLNRKYLIVRIGHSQGVDGILFTVHRGDGIWSADHSGRRLRVTTHLG